MAPAPAWTRYSHERLLDVRLCDLGLTIEGTPVERHVAQLYRELERRDIRLEPHVWLSSEWFSPDGIPGIAIPFYLAHPRLKRLERRMMLEVEGGTKWECMRLLRHEAGHAISNAYRLHRKKKWREVFGNVSQRYPAFYHPEPYSQDFVLHLDWWYAQAHPAEDFAETFAVWLRPRSHWRQQYKGWPALAKLERVDELIGEIAGKPPLVRSRRRVEPLHRIRRTLRAHYEWKQRKYGAEAPDFYDRDLKRLFAQEGAARGNSRSAAAFLRRMRPEIRHAVARWTGQYEYTIDQVLRDMIERCKDLNLRLTRPEADVKQDAMLMLAVTTMNYLHGGHHRMAL